MRLRTARATTIVLFALVMGVFWGTWFSLSRTQDQLPPGTFLDVGHAMIDNLGTPMAVLLPVALLAGLVTIGLLWPARGTPAFWWTVAGVLLMVGALVVTLAVEVPIDDKIKVWTTESLPADWRDIQARWQNFHTLRTALSVGAVVAVTVGSLLPAGAGRRSAARTERRTGILTR